MRLFNQLRPNQNYESRLDIKNVAKKTGLLIEEGILTDVGESLTDIVTSIDIMGKMGAHKVRVMSFIPQKGTPMFNSLSPDRISEMLIIAVLRLLYPDRLIPASLDIDGIKYLRMRLDAGANVITSLIPPNMGLAGVVQAVLDIKEDYRTVKGIGPILEDAGLEPSSVDNYTNWVRNEKNNLNGSSNNKVLM